MRDYLYDSEDQIEDYYMNQLNSYYDCYDFDDDYYEHWEDWVYPSSYLPKETKISNESFRFIEGDGTIHHLVGSKHHRLDGPAIIYPDGREEYWFDNELTTATSPKELLNWIRYQNF